LWRALVNNRAPNEAKVFLLLFLQKKKILPTRSKGIQSVARFSASGDPTSFWFRTLALCFAEQVYAPADRIWAHHALNIVGRYRWWRNRELMTAIHPV
jgi:hypothetical protein